MGFQDWCALAVALTAVITLAGSAIGLIIQFSARVAVIETNQKSMIDDINTMQGFLLKRGAIEAVQKGFGKMNSPLVFNPDVKDWFMALSVARDIRKYTSTIKKDIPEQKLAFEIEKKFADKLIDEICIPKQVNLGVCLLMALEIANGDRRKDNMGHMPDRRK